MSMFRREQEVKLELIHSIALSQQALARILGSIADLSSCSELSARSLQENARLLTEYQGAICRMLTGISFRRTRIGSPASPWLNASHISATSFIFKGSGGTTDHEEDGFPERQIRLTETEATGCPQSAIS